MSNLKGLLKKINFETAEEILSTKVFNIELSVLVVAIAVGIYTIVFSYFTIMKNFGFRTYAWDLGIFDQALWTTLHDGKFFFYTGELLVNPSGSFFGIHISPILFLVLPVYAVYPAPQTLLVLQSFALASGTIPLYLLTKNALKYRLASIVFVLIYLLYPPLQGINWFDFHVQCFFPLFFFSAIYSFEKQSWKTYFLFIVLSLMVEEHASMIVVFIGLFGLLQHRKKLTSIVKTRNFGNTSFLVPTATILLGVLWFLLTLCVRDLFFPINPNFIYEFNAAANWSILGVENPIMVPLYLLLYPSRAIAALSYDFLAKIAYLIILFGPLALKPFSRMRYLIPTAPWFLLALFSNYQAYYGIFNQYPTYVIAFIFIAAVYAVSRGKDSLKELKKSLAVVFFCGLVAFMLVSPLSPVVTIVYPEYGFKPITQHEELLHQVLTYLPQNASVMTQSNIFPHVSSRINAYVVPVIHQIWREKATEFRNFTDETLKKVEYILLDFESDLPAAKLIFSLMQENHRFKVFVSADSIILFKKDFNDKAEILVPYEVTYNYANLTLYSGEVVKDPNSTSGTVMYFNGSSGSSPMFWYGPRSILPPGSYNITLGVRLDLADSVPGEIFTVQICSDNGQNILKEETLFGNDSANKGTWMNQTFFLNSDKPLTDFEIRAINVSADIGIYLDYIDVEQFDIP